MVALARKLAVVRHAMGAKQEPFQTDAVAAAARAAAAAAGVGAPLRLTAGRPSLPGRGRDHHAMPAAAISDRDDEAE